jgi:hypothetical protein
MAGQQHAEHGSGGNRGPGPHHRLERLVGRAQAVVVIDRNHTSTADRPGEDHDAGARREHRLTDRSKQVGAAVSRSVRVLRRPERRGHGRRRRQRPRVSRPRCRHPGPGRRHPLRVETGVVRCSGKARQIRSRPGCGLIVGPRRPGPRGRSGNPGFAGRHLHGQPDTRQPDRPLRPAVRQRTSPGEATARRRGRRGRRRPGQRSRHRRRCQHAAGQHQHGSSGDPPRDRHPPPRNPADECRAGQRRHDREPSPRLLPHATNLRDYGPVRGPGSRSVDDPSRLGTTSDARGTPRRPRRTLSWHPVYTRGDFARSRTERFGSLRPPPPERWTGGPA